MLIKTVAQLPGNSYLANLLESQRLDLENSMSKVYWRYKDFQRESNIKLGTLHSKVSKGEIPHIRLGRLVLFDRDEILEWLEKHKVPATENANRRKMGGA